MCEFCGCDDKRMAEESSGKRKSPFPVIKVERKAVGEGRGIAGSDALPQAGTHEGQKLAEQTEAELGQPAAGE